MEKRNNYYKRVPGAAGVSKRVDPAIRVDKLRGRRKGDPQHSCCGKKEEVLMHPAKMLY